MRLVKVSNTERKELDNAHRNLQSIYNLGLKAKITAVIQPISSVIMLITIAVILGFVPYVSPAVPSLPGH